MGREEHGGGEGPFPDVRPGRLSDGFLVGNQIEGVIGDLKHHPYFPGPFREGVDDGLGRISGRGSESRRRPDQRGCLPTDHFVVFVYGVIEVSFELQLFGLTFDQVGVGGGEQTNRLLTEVRGGHLRCASHQKVSGQDCHRVRPVGIDRWRAAPHIRFIDHIVVIERADMDQLHRDAGFDRAMIVGGAKLCSQQGKQRAKAFSSREKQMLGDLGEVGVIGSRRFEQTLFHSGERGPYAGDTNEALEFIHS